MRKPLLAALLAATSIAISGTAARAATTDVVFHQMKQDAPEANIVGVKVPEVTGIKGAVIETAVMPIDSTNKSSVLVRVVSPKTCDQGGKRCRTLAIKAGDRDWDVVFDRKAESIQLGNTGFGTMRQILVDNGYEVWGWNGYGYHMDVTSSGTPVALSEVKSPAAAGVLVQQFGPGAKRLSDRRGKVRVMAAALDLNGKGAKDQLLVRLDGPGICGLKLGCPWRVLTREGQGYRTLLNGFGSDRISVMPVARGGGWRDLAAELPGGLAVFGWSGKSYGVAEVSTDKGVTR